jgi:nucleoside-diphosphate-sugar epimerase
VILVTGVKGVMGRAVIERFNSEGIDFVGVHREKFDLSKGSSLVSYVGRRPMAIVHLAAAVTHSPHYPDTVHSAHITRTIDQTVYLAAKEWKCRLIYASACSLYEKHIPSVKFEKSSVIARTNSPYLNVKYEGEQLFQTLNSSCVIRIPAPLGINLPDRVVAMHFLKQAIDGQTIKLWGSGKREQNYVDVSDIADIFFKAVFSKSVGVFNIASNVPTTMLELASVITRIAKKGSFAFTKISDPLEGEYARYSNKLALEEFGWVPRMPIEESIRSMVYGLHMNSKIHNLNRN